MDLQAGGLQHDLVHTFVQKRLPADRIEPLQPRVRSGLSRAVVEIRSANPSLLGEGASGKGLSLPCRWGFALSRLFEVPP